MNEETKTAKGKIIVDQDNTDLNICSIEVNHITESEVIHIWQSNVSDNTDLILVLNAKARELALAISPELLSELTQQQEINAELQTNRDLRKKHVEFLKKQNEELVAFLKQLNDIEEPIWRLKSFDVDRIKREISELINTPPKN